MRKGRMVRSALIAIAIAMLAAPMGARADAIRIGEDVVGDWGRTVGPEAAVVGELAGADLTFADIDPDEPGIVKFIIGVSQLPEPGGSPEVVRYLWNISVNEKLVELDGKFTNFSRGTCDPTAGTCPPPRNPGVSPFSVRGNCVTNDANVTTCTELALVNATFDAATDTITIPVPSALLGEGCFTIFPASNLFPGSTVATTMAAFVSSSGFPYDGLAADEVVVPVGC